MPVVDPGRLRWRITLQSLSVTRGSAGGTVETWTDIDTVWAEKIEQGTSEFRAAGAVHAEATRLFRIRWRTDLTEKHRVSFEGRAHDILGLPEEGYREFRLLNCRFTEGRP